MADKKPVEIVVREFNPTRLHGKGEYKYIILLKYLVAGGTIDYEGHTFVLDEVGNLGALQEIEGKLHVSPTMTGMLFVLAESIPDSDFVALLGIVSQDKGLLL